MAQRCTICEHDQREAIDEAIVSGRSLRDVGATFGLSKDAVRRHKDAHVSPSLARLGTRLQEVREDRPAESLIGRMETLYGRIEALLDRAEDEGRSSTFLAASRELRATAELLAKLTGILDDRPQTVNLHVSAEWLALRGAILQALVPFPDARQAVVHALRGRALEAG